MPSCDLIWFSCRQDPRSPFAGRLEQTHYIHCEPTFIDIVTTANIFDFGYIGDLQYRQRNLWKLCIYVIIYLTQPTLGRSPFGNHPASRSPERNAGEGNGVDRPPIAASPLAQLLVDRGPPPAGRGRDAHPLGPAPHHVSHAHRDEGAVCDPGQGAVAGKPVRDKLQTDIGAVALDDQGQDPVHEDVRRHHGRQEVPTYSGVAHGRPAAAVGAVGRGRAARRLGAVQGVHARGGAAVAAEVLRAADEADGDA